jgi:TatD DNase family protein
MNLDGMFEGRYNGKRHHEPDLAAVLARAAAAGVRRIILTGTNLEESRKALAFARAHNASGALPSLRLFSTVGLHPTCTAALELPPDELEAALLALALDGLADRTVVFIGECGLDFERLHFSPEAQQRRHFPMHLRLARRTGLPLFLHDRATHGALLALCAEHGGLPPAGGVVHSFTGTAAELAGMLAQPGLCIGLNGCGLKTAENCAVAATIPLQRLLLETDAPWCSLKASSPAFAHARRDLGRAVRREKWEAGALVKDRNEPCAVVHVAEAYAGLAGVPVERVAAEAEANLQRLLGAFM